MTYFGTPLQAQTQKKRNTINLKSAVRTPSLRRRLMTLHRTAFLSRIFGPLELMTRMLRIFGTYFGLKESN